jgi:hypothetical protein
VPNTIELGLHWAIDEYPNATTKLHFSIAAASATPADLQTLVNGVGAALNGNVSAAIGTHVKLVTVTATELGSGQQNTASAQPNMVGTRAGAWLPANACVLALYKIGVRYRGGKPRSYLPFGTAPDLADAQTLTSAAVTDLQQKWITGVTNIIGIAAGSAKPTGAVTVSYYGGTPPALAQNKNGETTWHSQRRQNPVTYPVLNTTISTRLASQRRRLK